MNLKHAIPTEEAESNGRVKHVVYLFWKVPYTKLIKVLPKAGFPFGTIEPNGKQVKIVLNKKKDIYDAMSWIIKVMKRNSISQVTNTGESRLLIPSTCFSASDLKVFKLAKTEEGFVFKESLQPKKVVRVEAPKDPDFHEADTWFNTVIEESKPDFATSWG